jgi:hypothetical protein
MNGSFSTAHMQQHRRTSCNAADCVTITVQLQTKMYSWNEWLAWLCLLSNAHMQQRTAVVLQHAADCGM